MMRVAIITLVILLLALAGFSKLTFATAATVTAVAPVKSTGVTVEWTYQGKTAPQYWGHLDSAFAVCSTGTRQSPIDINTMQPDAKFKLALQYKPSFMYIGKDLDTKIQIGNKQEVVNTGHGLQLNFHGDPKESLTYRDVRYELVQFHFHTPSETKLNGKALAGEIHFVHEGAGGQVAVLAVLIETGKENPALKKILDNVPSFKAREQEVAGENVNPGDLVPAITSYYAYSGSLTTPPCTEGLQWLVVTTPLKASPGQIAKIRQQSGGDNARPVQALSGRALHYAVK